MATVLTLSNHYNYQLMKKKIDLSADTLVMVLMNNTFTLADIALAEDDVNDKGKMIYDNISWTASGGSFGLTGVFESKLS